MSHTPLPPGPKESAPVVHIFCLNVLSQNLGIENTAETPSNSNFFNFPWRVNCMYSMMLYNCLKCGTVFCPLQSWQTKSVSLKCQWGRLYKLRSFFRLTKNSFKFVSVYSPVLLSPASYVTEPRSKKAHNAKWNKGWPIKMFWKDSQINLNNIIIVIVPPFIN